MALWYVVLTVAGPPQNATGVRAALERLSEEQPFLLNGRFSEDRAELRYWEEAETLEDACALALRLWGEHRKSAGLPPWVAVGLEVVDRDVLRQRGDGRSRVSVGSPVSGVTGWQPY